MSIPLASAFAAMQPDPDGWYTFRVSPIVKEEIETALFAVSESFKCPKCKGNAIDVPCPYPDHGYRDCGHPLKQLISMAYEATLRETTKAIAESTVGQVLDVAEQQRQRCVDTLLEAAKIEEMPRVAETLQYAAELVRKANLLDRTKQ